MNEQLQERLDSYLTHLESSATSATEFAVEQAPLVVQEYLNWCFYASLFGVIFWLIAVVVSLGLSALFFRNQYKYGNSVNDGWGVLSVIFGLLTLIPTGLCAANLYDLIKVLAAPRILVLDYVTSLLS